MYPFRTITATEMRGINRTAILEMIRSEGPIARTVISEKLNVSLPTVIRLVDELINEKLVRDTGERVWSGGRKRSLVELNQAQNLTLGLDLGGPRFYGAVADLGGRIVYEKTLNEPSGVGEEAYVHLTQLIDDLLAVARPTGNLVRGIGVGAPGITQAEKGLILNATSIHWRNFPLGERLSQAYSLPVIVENDINLAALGEMWFGAGQNANNFVLLSVGQGVGAAIILNRTLYRGANRAAGELGFVLPAKLLFGKSYPQLNHLDHLVSAQGMLKHVREILHKEDPQIDPAQVNLGYLFQQLNLGTPWALDMMDDIINYLAILISTTCGLIDPELIILGGGLSGRADLFIPQLQERLKDYIFYMPALVSSKFGPQACVKGAVINLLHNTGDFYQVQKLS